MELKSMKLVPSAQAPAGMPGEPAKPEYPYGLCLSLDSASLASLGIDKMPAIGAVLTLHAQVRVTDLHESEGEKRLGLQITDMALSGAEGDAKEAQPQRPPAHEVFYATDGDA
jgi:hypothetical protein